MQGLCALLVSIVAGAIGQLTMKAGLQNMHTLAPNPMLILGVFCYAAAMISWILALKKYDLSFAYPLLSLGYLLVYIGAHLWPELGEELTLNKTIGLILIILGVTVSAQGSIKNERDLDERQRTA